MTYAYNKWMLSTILSRSLHFTFLHREVSRSCNILLCLIHVCGYMKGWHVIAQCVIAAWIVT